MSGATAFDTIEEVLQKVQQLLWHDNEGWVTSTMHFDCILYQRNLLAIYDEPRNLTMSH
jgi:hypothetical protein